MGLVSGSFTNQAKISLFTGNRPCFRANHDTVGWGIVENIINLDLILAALDHLPNNSFRNVGESGFQFKYRVLKDETAKTT